MKEKSAKEQSGNVEPAFTVADEGFESRVRDSFSRQGLMKHLGAELVELSDVDRAVEHLTNAIARRPSAPYEAEAVAELELGMAYARSGRRDRAAAAFDRAIAAAPRDDPSSVRDRARAALRRLQ